MTEKERSIKDAMTFSNDGDVEIRRTRRIPTGNEPQRQPRPQSVPQSGSRQASASRHASAPQRPQSGSRQANMTNQAIGNRQAQGGARPASAPQSPGVRRQTSITPGMMRSDGSAPRAGTRAQGGTARTSANAAPVRTSANAAPVRTSANAAPARTSANAAPVRSAQSASAPSRTIASANASDRGKGRSAQTHTRPKRSANSSSRKSDKLTAGCIVRRSLLSVGTALLLVVVIVFGVVFVIAHGPSETARNKAVMSAMQASATKWVPGLFLSSDTVNEIIENSKVVVTDVRPISDVGTGEDAPAAVSTDRWKNAVDEGIILETYNGKTFKGYVLLIRDPARVTVAIRNKNDWSVASRIFEIVEQYGALAAINGGEFPDNGIETLANPIGLTYSGGECVWDDGKSRTFIGFTKDNKLYVEEGTSRARADEVGIRDAVAFQNGNTLITNDGTNVTYYYADDNTGVAQRTAIGQLADGTVMFLVTDGRTAQSLGATKNDIIDTFIEYGAITAGMLDGGSSAMLWYRDWYTKYGVDESNLDDWQRKGLVNIYKAFTNPRAIPSYFIVK